MINNGGDGLVISITGHERKHAGFIKRIERALLADTRREASNLDKINGAENFLSPAAKMARLTWPTLQAKQAMKPTHKLSENIISVSMASAIYGLCLSLAAPVGLLFGFKSKSRMIIHQLYSRQ